MFFFSLTLENETVQFFSLSLSFSPFCVCNMLSLIIHITLFSRSLNSGNETVWANALFALISFSYALFFCTGMYANEECQNFFFSIYLRCSKINEYFCALLVRDFKVYQSECVRKHWFWEQNFLIFIISYNMRFIG